MPDAFLLYGGYYQSFEAKTFNFRVVLPSNEKKYCTYIPAKISDFVMNES